MELCPSSLLLKLCFFECCLSGEVFELLSDLFVFLLNVLQIALTGVKVVLVFPAVETSIVLLYYFGLLVEELRLLVFVFTLLFVHERAATVIASQNSLHSHRGIDFVIILPLDFEHTPVLLDYDCSVSFLITELFGIVEHGVVGVNDVSVSFLSFLQVQRHLNLITIN